MKVCITVLRSRAMLDLRRQQCLEQPGVTVISRVYLKYIIAEIFILLIQPYPFLNCNHYGLITRISFQNHGRIRWQNIQLQI